MGDNLENENQILRNKISELEARLAVSTSKDTTASEPQTTTTTAVEENGPSNVNLGFNSLLTAPEICRYSRQLLLHDIGVSGQCKLRDSSVLIVGAGGLGSSAALYLAGAGVGRIGITDNDVVDTTNLHRQIIHNEYRQGMPKAISAKISCLSLNSSIKCEAFTDGLTLQNALDLIKNFDVVLDASDNVATRYLINDACVILKKPLVSGSAIRFEGQLTVYNYNGGPCYRCMFPQAPPIQCVTNCSDGGVLGAVPGTIGCLQALEAQKIIIGMEGVMSQRLLLMNSKSGDMKVVKIRGRNAKCAVCGDAPTITAQSLDLMSTHMKESCDLSNIVKVASENSATVQRLAEAMSNNENYLLLDVRDSVQYDMCSLPNSLNIPERDLHKRVDDVKTAVSSVGNSPVFVLCRRGISSARSTHILLELGINNVYNVTGGLTAWANHVDASFPLY